MSGVRSPGGRGDDAENVSAGSTAVYVGGGPDGALVGVCFAGGTTGCASLTLAGTLYSIGGGEGSPGRGAGITAASCWSANTGGAVGVALAVECRGSGAAGVACTNCGTVTGGAVSGATSAGTCGAGSGSFACANSGISAGGGGGCGFIAVHWQLPGLPATGCSCPALRKNSPDCGTISVWSVN